MKLPTDQIMHPIKYAASILCLVMLALSAQGQNSKSKDGDSSVQSGQSRGTASYRIDVTVVLSSDLTQGSKQIMVELRRGEPGTSKVVDTQYFEGQTGTVCFSHMRSGSYFIAIGNGDTVAVGPVRHFSNDESVHTRVKVTYTSGNIGTKSRSSL